jgi:hypothetical protein
VQQLQPCRDNSLGPGHSSTRFADSRRNVAAQDGCCRRRVIWLALVHSPNHSMLAYGAEQMRNRVLGLSRVSCLWRLVGCSLALMTMLKRLRCLGSTRNDDYWLTSLAYEAASGNRNRSECMVNIRRLESKPIGEQRGLLQRASWHS